MTGQYSLQPVGVSGFYNIIVTQELEGMRRRGRPRKGWKEEERSSSAGSEKMETVGGR